MKNDVIYKKICLESFKSRIPSLISYIKQKGEIDKNNGNWGQIPHDINLSKLSGLDELINFMDENQYDFVYDKEKHDMIHPNKQKRRLRYQNLMLWYHRMIDMFKNAIIYECSVNNAILKNTKEIWVQTNDFNIFDKDSRDKMLPAVQYNIEYVKIEGDEPQEPIEWDKSFYHAIVTQDDIEFFYNHNGFKIFDLVEKIQTEDDLEYLTYQYDGEKCDPSSYVDIPLVITSDIEDLGLMFNGEQEWIEGNKYEVGDIVTYDGSTYICDSENNGVYDEYYDEIYFDKLVNGAVELTNWSVYFDKSDSSDKIVTAEAISQLQMFKTNRLSYNDDGELLEGIIPYSSEGWFVKPNEQNACVTLNLPFQMGSVVNEIITDDGRFGDILYNIEEEENNIIRFQYGLGVKLDGFIKPIYETTEDGEKIITNSENLTGIHYDEAYIYSEQEGRERIEGEVYRIKYKKINFGLNVDNGSTSVILSTVRYKSQNVWNADTAVTLPTFRKDYLLGMSEFPTEDVDIVIDRGLSHAFERHLMLCETNTFNDLQNYRNNYFNLQ